MQTRLIEQRDRQDRTLYVPETLKEITYRNLVFMGGGVKGILQVGAVQELGKVPGFMENIKRVGGTSAGAITAGFLATGCPAKELHAQLASMMPYTQFLDGLALEDFRGDVFTDTLTVLDKITDLANPINLWRFSRALYQQRGLCSGKELHKSIEDKIAAKTRTGIENCTFGELAQLIKTSPPGKYRHLHVMVTKCLSQLEIRELSSEDPTCANYIISDAIRASASLPFLFEPWSLRKKYSDGQIVTEQEQYIDGGLLANYPIGIFDKVRYKRQGLYRFSGDNNPNSLISNEETLGFYIQSGEPVTAAVDAAGPAAVGKLGLLKRIMSFYYHAEEVLQKFKDSDRFRTVRMGSLGVGTCAFNIEEGQQAKLIDEGARAVREWHGTLGQMYAQRISVQLGREEARGTRFARLTEGAAAASSFLDERRVMLESTVTRPQLTYYGSATAAGETRLPGQVFEGDADTSSSLTEQPAETSEQRGPVRL